MINIEVPDQQTSLYLSNAKPSQLAKYPRISVSNIFKAQGMVEVICAAMLGSITVGAKLQPGRPDVE